MKTQEFVKRLKEISLTPEELEESGYTGIHFDAIWNEYNINYEENTNDNNIPEVLKLIKYNKNNKALALHDVSFRNTIEENSEYYIIGEIDIYLLIIRKKNGLICALDITEDLEPIFECALDSEKFLDALFVAMEYYIMKFRKIIVRNEINNEYYRKRCSEVAGGSLFYPFYKYVFIR